MTSTLVGVPQPFGIEVEKTFSLKSNEVIVEETHGKKRDLTTG